MKETEQIDWSNLGFGYVPTDYNLRCYYRNGSWGEIEVSSSDSISIPMAATCLHYGQEAFEGLKAYRGRDGKVRLFRPEENAARMQHTSRGILMPEVPTDLFIEMAERCVRLNARFIPPYESGATLYVRPLLIGLGQQVGVKPAREYLFMIFVTPVGSYFKTGFHPSKMAIMRSFDRAAPLGTGTYKVGGNYAASLYSSQLAHNQGYSAVLYLDARYKEYVDECGPANFFGIKGNTYITPESSSILPSITNNSLMRLAQDLGYTVEKRPMHVSELAQLDEAGACGTAAVISPIAQIDDIDEGKTYCYGNGIEAGPISTLLYNKLRAIQYGDEPDPYGWVRIVNLEE